MTVDLDPHEVVRREVGRVLMDQYATVNPDELRSLDTIPGEIV